MYMHNNTQSQTYMYVYLDVRNVHSKNKKRYKREFYEKIKKNVKNFE